MEPEAGCNLVAGDDLNGESSVSLEPDKQEDKCVRSVTDCRKSVTKPTYTIISHLVLLYYSCDAVTLSNRPSYYIEYLLYVRCNACVSYEKVLEEGSKIDTASQGMVAGMQTNGLRRTNEDKQGAVKAALGHPKAAGMSDRALANHVGVHYNTVAEYRKQLPTITKGDSRTGRDGRTINTANIGTEVGAEARSPTAVCRRAPFRCCVLTPNQTARKSFFSLEVRRFLKRFVGESARFWRASVARDLAGVCPAPRSLGPSDTRMSGYPAAYLPNVQRLKGESSEVTPMLWGTPGRGGQKRKLRGRVTLAKPSAKNPEFLYRLWGDSPCPKARCANGGSGALHRRVD